MHSLCFSSAAIAVGKRPVLSFGVMKQPFFRILVNAYVSTLASFWLKQPWHYTFCNLHPPLADQKKKRKKLKCAGSKKIAQFFFSYFSYFSRTMQVLGDFRRKATMTIYCSNAPLTFGIISFSFPNTTWPHRPIFYILHTHTLFIFILFFASKKLSIFGW